MVEKGKMSDVRDDIPVKDVSEAYRTKSLVMDKERGGGRRNELQDRVHELTDENVFLKKHSRRLEEKLKQLEAKFSRILAEKRYTGKKDEWDAEESKHRIIELEYQVGMLKDRLQVAKQQLVSYTRLFPVHSKAKLKHARATPSNSSSGMCNQTINSDLPEQFEILLLEAKTENQALESQIITLRDQVRSLERELGTTKELLQIKEIAYEDELNILRAQADDAEHTKQKLADNIQLIRLQRDSRRAASWLSTLETQCKAMESSLNSAQEENQQLQSELNAAQEELREAQQQNLNLQKQVEQSSADSNRIKELEALVTSLKEENVILKELNSSLESKAVGAAEKVRKIESEEANLKSQLVQIETTLKSELQSKSELYSDLSRERIKSQKLTDQLSNLKDKYSALEEELQKRGRVPPDAETVVGVSRIVTTSSGTLLDKKSSENTGISELRPATPAPSPPPMKTQKPAPEKLVPELPPIVVTWTDSSVQVDVPPAVEANLEQCEHCKKLEKDLHVTQESMTNLKDDLIRTKNLLKGQMATNRECHKEVEILSQKLEKADKSHNERLEIFMKALEDRSQQMSEMEKNLELLRTQTMQQQEQQQQKQIAVTPKNSVEVQVGSSCTNVGETQTSPELLQRPLPVISVPSVEIFVEKFIPNENAKDLLDQGLFATWDYGNTGTKYTPVVRNGVFNSGSTHALENKSVQSEVEIQIHQAVGPTDCVTLGCGTLSLENNSCMLLSSSEPSRLLGELRYSFLARGIPSALSVNFILPGRMDSASSVDTSDEVGLGKQEDLNGNALKETPSSVANVALAPSEPENKPHGVGVPKPKPRIVPQTIELEPKHSGEPLRPKKRQKSTDLSKHVSLRPLTVKHGKLTRDPNVEDTEDSEVLSDITNSPPVRKDSNIFPKKPILRRDDGSSPDVRRKNSKRVTMTEIVEERRMSTPEPEDENDELSEMLPPGTNVRKALPRISVDGAEGSENIIMVKESRGAPSSGLYSDSSESVDQSLGRVPASSASETERGEVKEVEDHASTCETTVDEYSSSQESGYGKNAVRIEISHIVFNSPCRFWSDPKIKRIYVEYRFLDFNPEELETPCSVPKPQPGKKAEFNFSKLFFIDTKERRQLLKASLLEKKNVRFTIVSEPPENDSLDCEDIGYAYVPFAHLAKSDLVQEDVPVHDAENPRHQLGFLCITIQAKDAIMTL